MGLVDIEEDKVSNKCVEVKFDLGDDELIGSLLKLKSKKEIEESEGGFR